METRKGKRKEIVKEVEEPKDDNKKQGTIKLDIKFQKLNIIILIY